MSNLIIVWFRNVVWISTMQCIIFFQTAVYIYSSFRPHGRSLVEVMHLWCNLFIELCQNSILLRVRARLVPDVLRLHSGCTSAVLRPTSPLPSSINSATGLRCETSNMPLASMNSYSSSRLASCWGLVQNRGQSSFVALRTRQEPRFKVGIPFINEQTI